MPDAKPVRLQRKRIKGFKMESPNGLEIVYVGRPSKWQNLNLSELWGAVLAVEMYRVHVEAARELDPEAFEEWIAPLRGKNLCCWCAIGSPCHADVLLEMLTKDGD